MGGVPCVCMLFGVNLRRESTTSRKHGMLDIRLGWDGMGWDGREWGSKERMYIQLEVRIAGKGLAAQQPLQY
jgi:hypothetical protein